jgi:sec-independent protein translocase protein TatB
LGPERLPKLARTAGNLFGRAQRYMSEVKEEVGRQMEQEELTKIPTTYLQKKEQDL